MSGNRDGKSMIQAELERGKTVALWGNFGPGNLGNESTLKAILHELRCVLPNAEISCICTGPACTATTHKVEAIPLSPVLISGWEGGGRPAKVLRSVFLGVVNELYRWLNAFLALKGTDAVIIPGTGLLTDAYGLGNWGPYGLFEWSLIAKLCGCKLLFVSVGVGPIYTRAGRVLVKAALRLADFRSYRDVSSLQYLQGIGFRANEDAVYPDLVFSLPELRRARDISVGRPVVGLGLMGYVGKYSVEKSSMSTYSNYLEGLVSFVSWLLGHGYDVRLLIGDLGDQGMREEFRALLKERSLGGEGDNRIISEPIGSVEDLLLQLAATDFVVATRFHNVLLSLLLNRPTIAISFHQKCSSLMAQMGLADYCLDINHLHADELIDQFCQLEKNAADLQGTLAERVKECRNALEEQYAVIVGKMFPERDRALTPASAVELRSSPGGHVRL